VVRVDKGARTLDPARFANSADVQIGEFVLAKGDPLGLTDSVTQGIVSSTSRWIKERGSGFIVNAIQTSAGINPGNSGGGLVDLNGEVIGIPTLEGYDPRQRSAAPGIGFAIPSNTVTRVASKLIGAYGHSVSRH
jgi:putative serine protease PepD